MKELFSNRYKNILTVLLMVFFAAGSSGLNKPVASKVYLFSDLADGSIELKGSTTHFEFFELDAIRLEPGQASGFETPEKELEKLFIIKEGVLDVSLGKETKTLGPNSIVLVLPGDEYEFQNTQSEPAVLYAMKYRSKNGADLERGKAEGGSFMIDFEELEYHPHNRGGIRNYYNRPTAMNEYFEMHVTNLNGLIKSHEPHTHGAAEIVLMIKGNTEMQIGDDFYQGTTGDIYFLESNVPHAIENKGEEQCMYFAFQWE